MMTKNQRAPRRSRQEWRQIIEELERSDCSATEFCRDRGLSYSSLMNWRNQFKDEERSGAFGDDWVELAPPMEQPESTTPAHGWSLEFRLGAFLTLSVRSGA